ncbi:MAG: TetR family transcriptional regulator [Mycobacteriales bacterium]
MSNVKSRRTYSSRVRAEAADRTREAVVEAALALFLAQGYAATTIDQIAVRAGVSRPTVFAVASKAGLLKLARDRAIAGDADPRAITARPSYAEVVAAADPDTTLRRYAHMSTGILRGFAVLNDVVRQAAGIDPELAELWQVSEAERLLGSRRVIDVVVAKGSLRPGLEPTTAAEILWTLSAPEHYQRLVGGRGWSAERFEHWYADTMVRLLLPDP